ncbi:hypothetical protein AWH63_06655 [Marinobacter sp. C18]|uniref:Rha family transcriptional regulator n=1 Tax=Marinobacter sp. C18 TaxID=1772288 RepID=UPI00096430DF|nr:Rha family transcriptional regulator [Marinobacter sp. C18]OLF82680.1 hypothetical protein AWH63_06655 [Marinobacter sp. C18]
MNQIVESINSGELTMGSRDIANLVESRHDSVKRAIERLAERGVIELPPTVEISTATKPVSEYRIGKRDSYVIVAQLSPEFTARLVDRWQDLEARAVQPAWLQNLSPQARVAIEDLNGQVEQLTHRVEHLENLFADGMTPAEFAKRLNGVNCQRICQELERRKWLYKDAVGNWRATSYARDNYLTERQSNIPRSSGQVMLRSTPVLLHKGASQIHKYYLAGLLPMKQSWDGQLTHDKAMDKVA